MEQKTMPSRDQRSSYVMDFRGAQSWVQTLDELKAHTNTGYLRGFKLDDYTEDAKKFDEFASSIAPLAPMLIGPKELIALYNLSNDFAEFGMEGVAVTMQGGMGSSNGGPKRPYFREGDQFFYLSQYVGGENSGWSPTTRQWFAHYFCTEHQWDTMQAIFSRIPGVMYL